MRPLYLRDFIFYRRKRRVGSVTSAHNPATCCGALTRLLKDCVNALCWHSGATSFGVAHSNNSHMSGANHPGSPPKIHQYLEDEACGVLAAVVRLSQSVMVSASLHRRGRGRALRRTQQAGLLPLLWQDNKRIYLLGGQDFRAYMLLLLRYPPTCFLCKIFAGEDIIKPMIVDRKLIVTNFVDNCFNNC